MLLRCENLSKDFGALRAINHLSLSVKEGEVKSVIGPNGAGKTTLFNMITGRFRPTEGRVFFNGADITGLKPEQISNKGLARSFQITNFFPALTVWENMRLAVQARHPRRTSYLTVAAGIGEVNDRTEALLRKINLLESKDKFAKNLSHGDQRHLEIGLALGLAPRLLLLDEPTSGMSIGETRATMDLIQEISQELTILLIEHDMDVVMTVSESVLVIHYGERIAEGTPEEVAADPKVQEVYLGGL